MTDQPPRSHSLRRIGRYLGENRAVPSAESRGLLDAAILSGIFVFLISFFTPDLILSDSTATGGDMAAHIYTPWYLRNELLPRGLIAGWSPGWYAGFPILHFYFPLVATAQALMSFLMPYEVAFKIGSILGTFFLPIALYMTCRLLRLQWPAPIAAAVLSLGFLFMDTIRLAGGNIASSLVGEYSYALSLGLSFVFLGLLWRIVNDDRPRPIAAAVVLALAALSHLVTVMVVVVLAPVFLVLAIRILGARAALTRLGVVFGVAFALTAFWSIPFVVRLPFTTNMNWIQREGWDLLVPKEMWLYLAGAVLGLIVLVLRRDGRLLILAGPALVGLAAYFLLPDGHIYNERFVPFWFVGAVLCCAYFIGVAVSLAARPAGLRWGALVSAAAVVVLLVAQAAWILHDRPFTFVDDWIEGNYEGYEALPDYPTFRALNEELESLPPGRVLWESNEGLHKFGSTVALMSLPYFANKPSMEGIHFESSPTTPFHFIMASDLAESPSQPIAGLDYPDFDLDHGVHHLELYDVRYYVSFTETARRAALDSPRLEHISDVDEFSIFEVGGPGQVVVPENEPVVLTGDWLEGNIEWFADLDNVATPLVADGPEEWQRIAALNGPLPEKPLPSGGESFEATVDEDEISFETTAVGEAHWIKTSYFPNWKVEGAEGPFEASPSLMMVIPTQERVRLYYSRTWAEWVGLALTGAALLIVAIPALRRRALALGGATASREPPRSPSSSEPRT